MYKDQNGTIWYKVQLHLHTTLSDGVLSPEDAARRYKQAGFDAIAITDHWSYHVADTIEGISILSGCEYNMGATDTATDVMHLVGVGMDEAPPLIRGACTRQQVIDAIHQAGGLAILAHPAWSLNTPAHAKELTGIDAVEIYNAVSDVGQSRRPYSGYFVDLLANEGIFYPLIATDDAHYYEGKDDTVSYIMVKAKSPAKEDLFAAIRAGEFYATQAPHLVVTREENRIVAHCSECVELCFQSNLSWVYDRVQRGTPITEGSYKIKPTDRWVRVEARDAEGRYAWSNNIVL